MRKTNVKMMGRALRFLAGASGLLLLMAGCGSGGSVVPTLPVVWDDVGGEVAFASGQEVTFMVSVADPNGDLVSLRLLNPQPGMSVTPIVNKPTPQTLRIRWKVPATTLSTQLVFAANDDASPTVIVHNRVNVRCRGRASNGVVVRGDVTGDGIPDVVAKAQDATVGGTPAAGSIYVWAGATVPTGAPTATLRVPGAVASDQLGAAVGQGVQLGDVTGDGVLDVVGIASGADVGGVADTGAIYVWAGGAALAGTLSPTATLTVPGAVTGDHLGCFVTILYTQWVQLKDVTGDGKLDVIGASEDVDVGGVTNTGAIYVWAGGPGLTGPLAPTATLYVPGAAAYDRLGTASGQGILVEDVTGNDGVLDVVAAAQHADVGGVPETGAIYVWAGGAGLTGQLAPTATLSVAGAVALDGLGEASGEGMLLGDVTGDGVPDVVAGARYADGGLALDTGAIYLWAGGTGLTGSQSPTASLYVPGAVASDRLGNVTGEGLQMGDVTGDGVLDVIGAAARADVGGVADTGAIYVWAGGPGLSGPKAPTAYLAVAGAFPFDRLGEASGQGVLLGDVKGSDGVLDVVGAASGADVGGTLDAGAIYVWQGGPTLLGQVIPTATLTVPGAAASDYLGGTLNGGQGVQLGDVTGSDMQLDVIATAVVADVGSIVDTGAIYVWKGGSTLSGPMVPTATLTVPTAVAGDQLGAAWDEGTQVGDVTGDGVLDVVGTAAAADVGGVVDTGAIYVWNGGTVLAGPKAPTATLTVPGAQANDLLGHTGGSGQGVQLGDVTGDGVPDVVGTALFADVGGSANAGAVYVWNGGPTLAASPSVTLQVPGAVASDGLGAATGQAVLLADVTGGGGLEVIGAAESADVLGVLDSGAIYLWTWASGPPPGGAPTANLTVPGTVTGDRLGH